MSPPPCRRAMLERPQQARPDHQTDQHRQYKHQRHPSAPSPTVHARLPRPLCRIYQSCAKPRRVACRPQAPWFPRHHSKPCGCSHAQCNPRAEYRRSLKCLPTSRKFHYRPRQRARPRYPHRIDKIDDSALVLAFHCAKQDPSHSGDRGLTNHCGVGHKPAPRAPSDHSAGQANRPLPLARQRHLRLGGPHRARIFQAPQPFPRPSFQARQSHNDDTHPRSERAFQSVRLLLFRNNHETLWAFPPLGAVVFSLWPWSFSKLTFRVSL